MSDLATFGPIRVSIEFVMTDGEQVAKANYECPPGMMPDEQKIAEAAAYTLAQVQSQLGPQFVWQTRHEFLSDEMAKRSGGVRFAIPGPDTWLAGWAA